jgi:small subunit ribosomal protein S6
MRSYDLVVVVRPSLKDDERKKLVDTIKSFLVGVKFSKEEEWGQKPLAYSIKKEQAGYYYFFKFETEESVPAGFEQKLLINENILRHLLLRTK